MLHNHLNFFVEAKYPIQIFQDNDLECSWVTIKVGWDLKRLGISEISNFAILFLEKHPNLINEYISELIIGIKEYEVENILKKLFKSLMLDFPEKDSSLWNKEWRKWRYCILSEMVKHISDIEDLLIKVEGIYADFGYPEDMKHFIYYMPVDEEINQNHEIANIRLVKKIKDFLQEERIRIQMGCDYLPIKMF